MSRPQLREGEKLRFTGRNGAGKDDEIVVLSWRAAEKQTARTYAVWRHYRYRTGAENW